MRLFRHSRESGNPASFPGKLWKNKRNSRLRGNDGKKIRHEDGFTLVELMVVLVILGLLATVVIINVVPALDTASETKARADIEMIDQAVQRYYLDNRRYPTTAEGLASLTPYLRRVSQDPWNRPYVYAAPGANGRPYSITSLGADGRAGGSGKDADITSN